MLIPKLVLAASGRATQRPAPFREPIRWWTYPGHHSSKSLIHRSGMANANNDEIYEILKCREATLDMDRTKRQRPAALDRTHNCQKIRLNSRTINQWSAANYNLHSRVWGNLAQPNFCFLLAHAICIFWFRDMSISKRLSMVRHLAIYFH